MTKLFVSGPRHNSENSGSSCTNGWALIDVRHSRREIAKRPSTDTRSTLQFIAMSWRPSGSDSANSRISAGVPKNEMRSPIVITLNSSDVTTTPNIPTSFSSPYLSRIETPVRPFTMNSNAGCAGRARPSIFFFDAATFTMGNRLWHSDSGWPRPLHT